MTQKKPRSSSGLFFSHKPKFFHCPTFEISFTLCYKKTSTMKKLLTMSILLSGFLLSCGNDDDDNNNDGQLETTLEMRVDGVLWVADQNQAGIISSNSSMLSMSGERNDVDNFGFSRTNVSALGTYDLPPGTMTMILDEAGVSKIYSLSNPNAHASVTLTNKIDNQLTGALAGFYAEADFEGVLYNIINASDSIVITEGKLRQN